MEENREIMVKICGITTPQEARAVTEAGADMGGIVVFFPKSKRCLSLERAGEVLAAFGDGVRKVAVTVSPDEEQIRAINSAGFDFIQIHGPVSEAALQAAELPVLKAFNVTDLKELGKYAKNEKIAGYVFDAAEYGSGKTFDWELLKNTERDGRLFILAGGLTPENVAWAVRTVRPDCVDVSSGVENDSGIGKDEKKIKLFTAAAKSALSPAAGRQ